MDYAALLERVLKQADVAAYLPLADSVAPSQRAAMSELERMIAAPDFDPSRARAFADRLLADGRIDRVMYLSARHVIAASPSVRDYEEAARLVGEQEIAAMRLGGPNLADNLASVDRHRGVLAFLLGQYEVAIDHFTRAFERQRSPGNLANVLATLLRLGDEDEARELHDQVQRAFEQGFVDALDDMIERDPDLALLRD